jgi:hypothetical protein
VQWDPGRERVTIAAVPDDLYSVLGITASDHRPDHLVDVGRIDILLDNDDPAPENDHFLDALRYLLVWLLDVCE